MSSSASASDMARLRKYDMKHRPKEHENHWRPHMSQKNLANVLMLKEELVNLKMEGDYHVKDHVQKLKAIAAKLTAIGERVRKHEFAFMLFNSLPPSYAHLVGTIDGEEEAKDLEYVIGRVEQEEQRLELNRERTQKTALLTRGEWKGKFPVESSKLAKHGEKKTSNETEYDPEDVVSHYCKKKGYIARDCVKKLTGIRKRGHN
ncbi:hypothetical protein L7F22_016637 [Adiantum nelumboides]|nr:hypothetical protein [Adiantum nelumboides]